MTASKMATPPPSVAQASSAAAATRELSLADHSVMTVRRRWILHVVGFLVVASVLQVLGSASVAFYSAWRGSHAWLENGSEHAPRQLFEDTSRVLRGRAETIASDVVIVAAAARRDRAELEARMAVHMRFFSGAEEGWVLLDSGQPVAGSIPCRAPVAWTLLSGPESTASCEEKMLIRQRVAIDLEGAELWLWRELGPEFLSALRITTNTEMQVYSRTSARSTMRSIDGAERVVSLPPNARRVGAFTLTRIDIEGGYAGYGMSSVHEEPPSRGARSVYMFTYAREIHGLLVVALIPAHLMLLGAMYSFAVALTGALALLLAAALLAKRFITRVTIPLARLEVAARTIADGDLSARAPIDGDREIRRLARHFNEMVERLNLSRTTMLQTEKLAAIGQLAAGVAHEINTPIQFVGDNTQYLKECVDTMLAAAEKGYPLLAEEERRGISIDELRQDVPAAIDSTAEGVRRVATIIRAMKEFSHPSSGKKGLLPLQSALESTATMARNEWKYVAQLEVAVDPALPPVPALRDELCQVFLNLIVNAAHAIDEGRGRRDGPGKIRITAVREGEFAVVRISDNGAGIRPEIRQRIFEPFFTTKPVGKGTGQGLAIAHCVVVDKHQGQIHVDSEVGVGTTFTIKLPLAV